MTKEKTPETGKPIPDGLRYEFNHLADYHQVYLSDEAHPQFDTDQWTPQAAEDMQATAGGAIAVGTERNVTVPVVVEVVGACPEDDLTPWDYATECSIRIPSGRLVVTGCIDHWPDAARIQVASGVYQARVNYGGLDTISADG